MKIDNRVRFTLRLPSELFKLVGTEANALGQPMNALILQILWGWVKNQNEAS